VNVYTNERTDGAMGQLRNIMSLPTMSGDEGITKQQTVHNESNIQK